MEFELPRNYYIDLSGVSSFEQFVERLPKNKRRNYRQRQEAWQRLAASSLTLAYEPLPLGQTELVEQLWMLYRANAQRNGLCVTNERRFKRVHLNTPGLSIATIRDASQGGRIVCFATGFRSGDALISAWCGTDYDHPLARSCYFCESAGWWLALLLGAPQCSCQRHWLLPEALPLTQCLGWSSLCRHHDAVRDAARGHCGSGHPPPGSGELHC